MEPEGSLPHSQEPATCPYPEPYQSSPCPHISIRTYLQIETVRESLNLPYGVTPSQFWRFPK
jgi:hypothetical protein